MGNQLILRRLPAALTHDVFTKTLMLEDVLVSTVFGAISYGPPAMFNAWRRRFTTLRPTSPELRFEFWPTNQRHGDRHREPDVFLLDVQRRQALVVEAKRRLPKAEALAGQLIDEGLAARATYQRIQLHLLVVSDDASEPTAAFQQTRTFRPRLYSSRMCHASWDQQCDFLRDWSMRRDCDAGHRRMIEDALAVMAKYEQGRSGSRSTA